MCLYTGQSTALSNFLSHAIDQSTRRRYTYSLTAFDSWCETNHVDNYKPTPTEIADFVRFLTMERKPRVAPTTIGKWLSAISSRFASSNNNPVRDPIVHQAYKASKHILANIIPHPKPALSAELLGLWERSALEQFHTNPLTDNSWILVRNMCILIFGFLFMLRRTELVNLSTKHVTIDTDKVTIALTHTKTTSQAYIPLKDRSVTSRLAASYSETGTLCPVRWAIRWQARRSTHCPYFFHSQKQPAIRLAPATVGWIIRSLPGSQGLSAHSLRSGGATAAAGNGAPLEAIRRAGRWSIQSSIVHNYIRPNKVDVSVSKAIQSSTPPHHHNTHTTEC